jgi:hypothetical protein
MTKNRDWKVTHHFANKQPFIEFYSRRADAVRTVKEMESANFNDEQYSEIENVRTGCRGSRRWGRRRILWTQAEPSRGPFPSPKDTPGGLQLSFGVVEQVTVRLGAEVDAAGVTK